MKSGQTEFFKIHWRHRLCAGGKLRQSRLGRNARPISTKDPLHIVFKVQKSSVRGGLRSPKNFSLIGQLIRRYSKRFFVSVEQCSIQIDHIHLLIRVPKRAFAQHFLRVLAGQFAQKLTGAFNAKYEGPRIWKYRPFTRVVRGYRAYRTVRDYIQLNECEVRGRTYRSSRLRGLSDAEIEELWI